MLDQQAMIGVKIRDSQRQKSETGFQSGVGAFGTTLGYSERAM
jgi:hypothetical protein